MPPARACPTTTTLPLTLVTDDPAPAWATPVTPRGLLATASDSWTRFRFAYLRLLVAAAGPLVVGGDRALRYRYDVAGWRVEDPRVERIDAPAARALSGARWPTRYAARLAGAVGSCAPRLLFVGERETVARGLPFLSRSGAWLLEALRILGRDELEVALVNVKRPDGELNARLEGYLAALAGPAAPVVIALGEEAQVALDGLNATYRAAMHPAWHRRFRHGAGPAGYAAELRAAGVPRGEWTGGARPGEALHVGAFEALTGWDVPGRYVSLATGKVGLLAGGVDPG